MGPVNPVAKSGICGQTSKVMTFAVNIDQLAPEEPLSPELVLVLPPQLRAEVLASLGPPVWPEPRPRAPEPPPALSPPAVFPPTAVPVPESPPTVDEPFLRSLAALVGARVAQLGVIFAIVTIVTLVLSIVAHAVR